MEEEHLDTARTRKTACGVNRSVVISSVVCSNQHLVLSQGRVLAPAFDMLNETGVEMECAAWFQNPGDQVMISAHNRMFNVWSSNIKAQIPFTRRMCANSNLLGGPFSGGIGRGR